MRKLLIAVGVLVVLLLVAVFVGPSLIPKDVLRQQIAEQAKQATGRDLAVNGDIDISIIPLRVSVGEVSFANAKWGQAPQMATLQRLLLDVDLMPLLGGQLKVNSFVLDQPEIAVEINKQGRGNWEFAGPVAPDRPASSQSSTTDRSSAKPAGAPPGLSEITLGDVRLANGKVTFIDHASGTIQVVENINMALDLPSLMQPFKADGGLSWNNQEITITADTGPLAALLFEGKPTEVALTVGGRPVKLAFDGDVTLGAIAKVAGALDLDVPSIRGLAAWAGNPLPEGTGGTGLGPLKIKGTVGMEGQKFSFTDADIAIDAISAKGNVTVDAGRAKPSIAGNLDVAMLDLNPYLGEPAAEGSTSGASGGTAAPGSGANTADEGWSKEPIDASGLRAVDAAFDLRVEGIRFQKIKIGKGALDIRLRGGKLLADLKQLDLYEGGIKGRVNVDGSGAKPAIELDVDLAGVQARPMLTDAADMSDLEGLGNFDLAVTARGGSQYEMVRALNGKGSVKFQDGAIYGNNFINVVMFVVKKLRDLQSGNLAGLGGMTQSEEKTTFSELGGSFTITNGLLRNDDFLMLAPLARLRGKGTVPIPDKALDYLITPKLVASLQGQGGDADAAGIGADIKVSGPWSKPEATPILLPDAGQAVGAVKNLLKGGAGASGGGAEGLVKGLIGGGTESSGESKPASPLPDAGKALKGLFGR